MMLQTADTPEAIYAQVEAFRSKVADQVGVIVEELCRNYRRNGDRIASACLKIDQAIRDYHAFLPRIDAVRARAEQEATDHSEFIELRRLWGPTTANASLFRIELNRWHEMRVLVDRQRKPKRRRLYVPTAKVPEITMSQMLAGDDVFHAIHAVLNPADQSASAEDYGCFPDIGLSNSDFHAHLHAAYRVLLARPEKKDWRFLDVGCGAGLKVISAKRYFDEVFGFDYDPAYVDFGKSLATRGGLDPARIFQQNALSYDDYGEFDVIYFYRPMRDEDLLMEMEKLIVETAHPGTLLIAPYRAFTHRYEDLGCGHIEGDLYLAQASAEDAQKARRAAERMGPFIAKRDESLLRTVWSPILDQSRANGYDLPTRYAKPRY
ncbi:class I SAM-dependent methyltransferase [Marivita hallyeonensis]|uniref:Methyltransferase domain-containing protein n=1 Tax=Marivita hallyeonensis TaxID=996342 RepID=A0A1M5PGT3_9RHOB|nr:class I SAM-dependent methyltransferase [Marivita hallyeonensis]SHH01024.1 Methyltransferase domain-containing protein [Marivita hallyeonensis]